MSLFEVIHMIESLGIENAVKVFRAMTNGPFKQEHAFVSEPKPEPVGSDSELGIEPNIEFEAQPNVETNTESGTDPNDEPVCSDTESGTEPIVETNVESGTDPNDESVGSATESGTEGESSFEEDIFLLMKRMIMKLNQ
ncbi:hypothetical protein V6N12_035578 [Hibiscus sabdariffa]|uniref:Uncharacterized protein n=1 Tax=Hibiscus sabdariffa TaxID=183260 RepID=A0ABR2EQJ9_9ROSI